MSCQLATTRVKMALAEYFCKAPPYRPGRLSLDVYYCNRSEGNPFDDDFLTQAGRNTESLDITS